MDRITRGLTINLRTDKWERPNIKATFAETRVELKGTNVQKSAGINKSFLRCSITGELAWRRHTPPHTQWKQTSRRNAPPKGDTPRKQTRRWHTLEKLLKATYAMKRDSEAINPFLSKRVPHWRVKSSGVRQSEIYKCPEHSFGREGVKAMKINLGGDTRHKKTTSKSDTRHEL